MIFSSRCAQPPPVTKPNCDVICPSFSHPMSAKLLMGYKQSQVVIPDRNSDKLSEAQDPESRNTKMHGSRIKSGMTNTNKWQLNLAQRGLVGAIRLYQATLSPDHSWLAARFPGGYCRFSPSCSQYTLEAIQRHGAIRGTLMSANRIWRCNPWNPGGFDPVKPERMS